VSKSVDVDLTFKDPLDVDLSVFPTTFGIDITHIAAIPKISIGLDPITINPITVNPLDVSVRIKEIPSIRAHIPANFAIGLSVLGYDLACVRLCGEAQVITEPYQPNPCEHCGQVHRAPTPVPVPGATVVEVPK
jgi:hypothetical protein